MKKIILSLYIGIACQWCSAQIQPELKTLISKSFNYFPKVQELAKASEMSGVQLDIAKANYYPIVSAAASYSYLNPISKRDFPTGPGTTSILNFQPYNNYNTAINIILPIWDFGRTQSLIDKAKANMLIANTNVEQTKIQLASQISGIYFSVIYLKRAITVEDSLLAFLNESLVIIQNRIKRGDALQIDMSSVQSNIDQEENRKVDFVNSLQKQRSLLTYATGEVTESILGDFDFPLLENQDQMDYANKNNIDLQLAKQRIMASEFDLKTSLYNRNPIVSAVASTGIKNGYQPDIEVNRFNYLVGLNLSIPIYQGGKISQNIELSRKMVDANQLAKVSVENNLKKDLSQVLADLASSEHRIKNSSSQVNFGKEYLLLVQSRYKLGVATHLDLMNAASNLERVLLNQVQFEYQRCLSRVELARLLGWKYWLE